jgi:hypothetical protein
MSAEGSEGQSSTTPSICSACPELKFAYESCFHKWYHQFTAGLTTDLGCVAEFQQYKECVWVCLICVWLVKFDAWLCRNRLSTRD